MKTFAASLLISILAVGMAAADDEPHRPGAATLLPRAEAELPAAQTVFGTQGVDLRDGSRLLGRPEVETLLLESAIGTTVAPPASIRSLETTDQAGTAVIGLRGEIRPDGTVRPNPLTLQTSVGELNMPPEEVVTCSVESAVTSVGNVALSARGATVRGVFDGGSGPALIDGNTTDYGAVPGSSEGASYGSAHIVGLPPSWVVELPQTFLLREIRVLLWDRDQRFYRYLVETSVDGQMYCTAADRSEGEWRGWQKLAFSPRPVRYIRLRGLYSSRLNGPNGMHVVELEAYCHPPRDGCLVLWNKLGSKKEIHESEVGPGGTYSGEGGRFVEGRFGGALSATAKEIHYQQPALVTFPKEVISTDAGCIEVWAKLDGLPKTLKWGENPALLKMHDGKCSYIIHLNGNDGASNGGLCGRAGGNASAGTGVFGTWTYEQVLGPGQIEQWHHYALVWDKNGIPGVDDGTRTIALFLDGKLNSQEWRKGAKPWVNKLSGGELRLLLNHQLAQGRVALDNLRIWDYAKTDFSDRFVEGISPVLAGVLADPPGEFQVDYAGLRWDLWRTGWNVEDGRLSSRRYVRPGFQYGHWGNGRGGFAITGHGDKSWIDYEVAFDYQMLPANREFFHAHIPSDSRGMTVSFRAKLASESWNQPHTCYNFGLSPKGNWSLNANEDWYMVGRGYSATNRKGKSEKLASGTSESGQDASQGRLRLRVKGSTITVWLNDERLVEHTHAGEVVEPIPYGGFGVTWRYESMGWISNLEVKKL